jgi:hypothetical protein
MRNRLLILLSMLLAVSAIYASDPWGEPVIYPGSMYIMAQVSINGSPAAVGDMLGAFVLMDGEYQLRGKETVMAVGNIHGCLLQLFCETDGEAIQFRVWAESSQTEFIAPQTLQTEVNGEVGSYPGNLFQINGIGGEVSAPVINPPGGSFTVPQMVSLTCATVGAQIRFTLDGSEPTEASALYGSPFSISASCAVQARAFVNGLPPSPITTAVFSFDRLVATPVFTPASGHYAYHLVLQMFCATPGALIYYTLDSSEPTPDSALYTGPLLITQTTTVKARAYLDTWEPSAVATAQYTYSSANQDSEAGPETTGISALYPNPFTETITFVLEGKERGERYVFEIYNLKGQCVHRVSGIVVATVQLQWNGTDTRGVRLPSGLYFARYSGAGGTSQRTVVLY